MTNIIIFSGTTEGRHISEALSRQGIEHTVCVATEYGRDIMQGDSCAHIHTGRMSVEEMSEMISGNQGYVIDATHPYAVEVTENIKKACDGTSAEYVRVVRQSEGTTGDVIYCQDMEEVSELLEKLHGNVLMTTGSKEIGMLKLTDMSRVYSRIIPSTDSISLCLEAGVLSKNIIAMQGPFSREMNKALIMEYEIKYLVTKESGSTGGVDNKLQAAAECGIDTVIIGRPSDEEGLTVNEVLDMLGIRSHITLVAMGMGDESTLTSEAYRAIRNAEIVFGPSRLIENIKDKKTFNMYRASDILPEVIEGKWKNAVVLYSGDTGFYSGASGFLEASRAYEDSVDVSVVCGISSVAYLAAKLKVSYDDAFIYSIHGKHDACRYDYLREGISCSKKTFLLLSGADDVRLLGEMLEKCAPEAEIILGDRLSYKDERIIRLDCKEAKGFDTEGLYIAFIGNEKAERKKLIPYLKDTDFIRNETPMTKEIIRHEIVRLLDIHDNDIVCDVGSGTGSVSIEIAGLSPFVKVYALEKQPAAIECMKENIRKFGCHNIELIEGDALNTIREIPAVDAVFVGGSTGRMISILKAVPRKGKDIRVVVTSVTIETLMTIYELEKELEISDMSVRQIAVTDIAQRGEHNMMQGNNPVFVCSFRMK